MANRLSGLSKAFAHVVPRHNPLRPTGRGLAGLLAAIGVTVLAVIGIREASPAPAPCAVLCAGLPGPKKASCMQACRQCQADVTRICDTPTAFICCPSGESCCGFPGFCCPSGKSCCGGVACCASGQCCFDCTVG